MGVTDSNRHQLAMGHAALSAALDSSRLRVRELEKEKREMAERHRNEMREKQRELDRTIGELARERAARLDLAAQLRRVSAHKITGPVED